MILFSVGLLYWDVLMGAIGLAMFIYGRKRPDGSSLIAGIVLMVYPYFISSVGWNIAVGLAIFGIYAFLKIVMKV